MIEFKNKDKNVVVQVTTPNVVTNMSVLTTEFETQSSLYAELLAKHLAKELDNALEDIRKDAYEAGYSAGRGKKAKRNWFGYRWNFRFGDQK